MPKLGLLLVFLAKLRLATAATALGAALCAALVAGFREVVLEVHSLLEALDLAIKNGCTSFSLCARSQHCCASCSAA